MYWERELDARQTFAWYLLELTKAERRKANSAPCSVEKMMATWDTFREMGRVHGYLTACRDLSPTFGKELRAMYDKYTEVWKGREKCHAQAATTQCTD